MTQKSELGREGEDFAAEYLKRKGYGVIERNKREKWGELDIVVMAPDKTLVFVEVKTMRPGILKPEDQMSGAKMKNSAGRRKYTRVPRRAHKRQKGLASGSRGSC